MHSRRRRGGLMAAERVLVNFFYAQPVGHAVEALHYCLGHHVADPTREIGVVLNAATAVELAGLCPFVAESYAIDHPLLEPCATRPRAWPAFRANGTGCSTTAAAGRTSSSSCSPACATTTRPPTVTSRRRAGARSSG